MNDPRAMLGTSVCLSAVGLYCGCKAMTLSISAGLYILAVVGAAVTAAAGCLLAVSLLLWLSSE